MAPRAYVGALTIRLGPLSTQGRLMPVRRKIRSQYRLCTPGTEPQPVNQCYVDPDGKTWWERELGRAEEDEDGKLIPVDPEQIAKAKQSDLPLNYLDLTVHPVADVNSSLFPSDHNAYIFQPVIKNSSGRVVENPANVAIHDVLNVLIKSKPEYAFVGRCNLQNVESIYRISIHMGHLMLQRQLHPEELNEYEAIDPAISPNDLGKAERIAEALVSPYDDETYADNIAKRLASVADSDFDPEAALVERQGPDEVDLGSILDAALTDL